MVSMIKISKMADYSVVILEVMARTPNEHISSSLIAQRCALPEPTVSKILKMLAREKIIYSTRGAGGGYNLISNPHEITIKDIITAIDGPISLTACIDGDNTGCGLTGSCVMRGRWDDVNDAIRSALGEVTLADMIAKPYRCHAKKQNAGGQAHGCH